MKLRIHHLSVDEVLSSLRSNRDGLPEVEAKRRRLEFGLNRVESVRATSLGIRFLKGFTHFFALILWVAAGLAFVAEWYDPGAGMARLGLAILGVILINGLFSFWQEYRAERALAELQKLLPHQVKAMRDRSVQQVSAEELVPGDVVLLDDGDDVPADCRVIEAFGVRVNSATLTGESVPQAKDERCSAEEDPIRSRNILLAGTSLVSGRAKGVVFATGMRTEFGQIARLSQHAPDVPSPLQIEIARLSRLVAVFSCALGLFFYCVGRIVGMSFWENFLFAIGVIVANVPEGLLPTLTLALALGSQRMARRNALIRHLASVETLGSATVICTDKTGTLTQGRMSVKRLFLSGRQDSVEDVWHRPDLKDDRQFFEVASYCHTLKETNHEGESGMLGDPLEIALVQMARKVIPPGVAYSRLHEIPFDSDRKRLSTLYRTPEGLVLYTKGALEAVLPLCQDYRQGAGVQPMTAERKTVLLHEQDVMADDGLRVLAFASRSVRDVYDPSHLEEDLTLLGLVGLEDPYRPEVPDAIRKCKQAGIRVIMVTGDHPQTARAIARQVGLMATEPSVVITGEQLRHLSDIQLQLVLDGPEVHFARVSADQKLRIVEALQAKRHVVAVTGDGVNDAPALRKADIGIAMGQSGTDVARAAADIVLTDDNFASIVGAVEEGRAIYSNVRKFLVYILTHNVAELVPYLAFVLFKIPLPLTVMQILAIDLGTDTLPALALGAEKPDPETMGRPPHSPNERLVNWPLLARSYLFLGLVEATAAMATFFFVLHAGRWYYGQELSRNNPLYLQATTACLSAIIVMQVVNVFLCRSDRDSVFSSSLFGNRLILVGIIAEMILILLVDYTRLGNLIFSTAPISISIWLFTIPFAIGMLILEEVRKWLSRRISTWRKTG